MTKRKTFIALVSFALVLVTAFYFTGNTFLANEQKLRTATLSETNIDCQSLFEKFDNATIINEETFFSFSGELNDDNDLLPFNNVNSLSGEGKLLVEAEYGKTDNNITLIYKNEDGVIIEEVSATPIVFEDGSFDGVVFIDNEYYKLSDLLGESQTDNCFFFTLTITLLSAKIIAAVIITAKVVLVITGVVVATYVVVGVTTKFIELTREKAKEAEKVANEKENKDKGKKYFPCAQVGDGIKLQMSVTPVDVFTAIAWIRLGGNMYTPAPSDAAIVLTTAGYVPVPHPAHGVGKYAHYHPFLDGKEILIAGDGSKVVGPKHAIHSMWGMPL